MSLLHVNYKIFPANQFVGNFCPSNAMFVILQIPREVVTPPIRWPITIQKTVSTKGIKQRWVGAGWICMFPTTRPAMNGFENQDLQPA